MIKSDGEIYEFEDSIIFEYIDIDDSDLIKNANLSITEFDIHINEHYGVIDIENDKLRKKELTSQEAELDLYNENQKIDKIINTHTIDNNYKIAIRNLANSISKVIVDENKDILRVLEPIELKKYISLIIINLIENRDNIDIYMLKSKKYQLKRAILKKLVNIIKDSKQLSFNTLFNKNSFTFDKDSNFIFRTHGTYQPNPDSRSSNFKKHKYEYVHKLDSKEEYEVAMYIDKMDSVSVWIKNIDRDAKNSFWLSTADGKFYPDFIIKYKSGLIVVAEYKGESLIKEYEDTKKPIADTWSMLNDRYKFISLYSNNYKDELINVNKY
jgi:hypothetical protein